MEAEINVLVNRAVYRTDTVRLMRAVMRSVIRRVQRRTIESITLIKVAERAIVVRRRGGGPSR
jgi:hypothetical protein